jgi:hypothetical protein
MSALSVTSSAEMKVVKPLALHAIRSNLIVLHTQQHPPPPKSLFTCINREVSTISNLLLNLKRISLFRNDPYYNNVKICPFYVISLYAAVSRNTFIAHKGMFPENINL